MEVIKGTNGQFIIQGRMHGNEWSGLCPTDKEERIFKTLKSNTDLQRAGILILMGEFNAVINPPNPLCFKWSL